MKRTSSASLFNKNTFQKRFFILSLIEKTIRYAATEFDAKRGKGEVFRSEDLQGVREDFSNGGRSIDFSGEREYPFPF